MNINEKTIPSRTCAYEGVARTLVFAVVVVLALVAGFKTSISAAAEAPVPKEDIVLVVAVINTNNPYFIANIKGAKALAKELNLPLKIVDANNSAQTQVSKLRAILAGDKTAVVFVNTVNSGVAPVLVDAVKRAGGYVTIWWNKPKGYKPWDVGDHFVAFQKVSGVQSGRCNARAIGEALNGTGDVIMLPGVKSSTTSKTRVAGFKDELKEKYPKINILGIRPSGWDPNIANRNAKDLIAKYGKEIDAVWSADDGMQIGAIAAFESAGLLDTVVFASDGLYPKTIQMMQNGKPIVGETFHSGYMASAIGLYTAYLAARGKIDPSELPKKKRASAFKLSCVTSGELENFLKYDGEEARARFVDKLIKNGPWNAQPMPLVGGYPKMLPELPLDEDSAKEG